LIPKNYGGAMVKDLTPQNGGEEFTSFYIHLISQEEILSFFTTQIHWVFSEIGQT